MIIFCERTEPPNRVRVSWKWESAIPQIGQKNVREQFLLFSLAPAFKFYCSRKSARIWFERHLVIELSSRLDLQAGSGIDILKCVGTVSCDFLKISARAHSCLSIVARDVQLCDVLLCDQQQRHNAWGPVTQHVMSCHTSHDVMSRNVSCHATKSMMHHLMYCIMPWQNMCNAMTCKAWCMMQLCDAMSHRACHTQTNIIIHVFTTHGGFCIEQTTVSWRTRIYAKNCKKCGKTLKIANNVEKHSYLLPC